MDMLSLIDGLAPDTLASVYILHGPERFFINEAIAKIKSIVLSGPMSEFNCIRLNAGEVSGAEIAELASEIPMMASKRLAIVEHGEKLKAEDFEQLDPYLKDPAPTTCLVITADKLDMRRGVLARANKRGQTHKSDSIKPNDINQFLRSRAKQRGVSFSAGAFSALAAAVGPDCAQLDDAVERLGLYAGRERQVNEEDVAEVVTAVREHSIFELVDAIGNQKPQTALSLLEGLLSRREEPLMINAMIARHFRLLLKTRIHLYEGVDMQSLPSLLGVPEFVSRKLSEQVRRFTGIKLGKSLAGLAHGDLEMKSCRRPARLIIEEVVLDLSISS